MSADASDETQYDPELPLSSDFPAPEKAEKPEIVAEEPVSEPEEAVAGEVKGAELPNVDRPCGMRARAQHHLDAYTAKLARTPHGGAGVRTCEVVISVCRDILAQEAE